ncbi:MAG: flagellar filament capping protein FliD [Planctomycetota bacterium]
MLTVDGLASGLDTTGLIQQLLEIQQRPILLLQQQAARANQKQTAFLDITARVVSLQSTVSRLADPATFNAVSASSSNESVLAASVGTGVPPGVYSFRVGQLASPSQYVSTGFADASDTAVGAGTLSLEYGGFVDIETELDELNGGQGVTRGSFRITDGSGNSDVIDIGSAVSVRDALEAINESSTLDVTAAIADDSHANTGRGLVLTDGTGGTITVEEIGGTDTAADLGLLGSSATGTLEGSAIRTIGGATQISSLLDGVGARGAAGDDFRIAANALASDITVDVGSQTTVQELLDAVNNHANNDGSIVMAVDADGDGFTLTDTSGTGGITVTDEPGGSSAASDLGILGTTAGNTIAGTSVLAGIDDIFLSTLNGGVDNGGGVASGQITIQDRASGSGVVVDLSSAETLQDVIRTINGSAASVTASINSRGNGLSIRDTSGGTGDLIVGESGSTTAADLGILGTGGQDRLSGTDLNPMYIHSNTRLSELNGGEGISLGSIRITSTDGTTATVNLGNAETMGDVIRNIEGQTATISGLSVGFNEDGNGLLITDTSGGGTLRIDEVDGGTTARDLHLLGAADAVTPTVINGAFEETITIGAEDTLDDVLSAIGELNIDVTAAILNDGSANGSRLSIIGDQSGRSGRLLIETEGSTALSFNRTSEARDGVLFYGETSSSSESILLRSSSNTYSDVIQGLTVSALTTSDEPVRVTVNRSTESLEERVSRFVEDFNSILSTIDDLTDYDIETEERGLLLGDGALRNAERQLLNAAIRPLTGVDNSLQLLSEVGIRVFSGRLTLDSSEFQDALEADPAAVEKLFTASRSIEDGTLLEDFNNGNGVDTDASGAEFEVFLRDGSTVEVDITGATTAEDIVDKINSAAAAAGVALSAELSSGKSAYILRDQSTGTETFRVTSANGSSAANDLGLNRSADSDGGGVLTGFAIDLTQDPGVAARLNDVIESLTDVDNGVLQRRADRFDTVIAGIESRIETLAERIAGREEQLRRQFAQLETVIQQSQSTQQRLAAQLGGLG